MYRINHQLALRLLYALGLAAGQLDRICRLGFGLLQHLALVCVLARNTKGISERLLALPQHRVQPLQHPRIVGTREGRRELLPEVMRLRWLHGASRAACGGLFRAHGLPAKLLVACAAVPRLDHALGASASDALRSWRVLRCAEIGVALVRETHLIYLLAQRWRLVADWINHCVFPTAHPFSTLKSTTQQCTSLPPESAAVLHICVTTVA